MSDKEKRLIRTLYSRDGFIEEVHRRQASKGTLIQAYWSVEEDH